MARPLAFSISAKGNDTPRACSSNAVAMYADISCGVRTGVGIQRHNSSSRPTAARSAWCACERGSSRTRRPSRVTGTTFTSVLMAVSAQIASYRRVVCLRERQFGVDRGSKETLAQAIETAQRSDTIIYSILFADEEGSRRPGGFSIGEPISIGPSGPGGGSYPRQEECPDDKKILEQISKE